EEILDLHWHGAKRNDTRLSVVFSDVDHFKSINDEFGHEAGDNDLCELSRRLQMSLRQSDSLLRWGGEEFLLVMPGADLKQARQALERIVSTGLGLRPDGRPLTASIGIAERLADNASDCRELLDLADQRMYL